MRVWVLHRFVEEGGGGCVEALLQSIVHLASFREDFGNFGAGLLACESYCCF